MTPKEALENIINEHNHLLEKYKINGGLGNWYLTVKKALTELEELKEKIRNLAGNHILSKIEEVFGENNSLVNKIDELLNLCKGSEE